MRKDWTLFNGIQKNTGSISKKNDELVSNFNTSIQITTNAYAVTQGIYIYICTMLIINGYDYI